MTDIVSAFWIVMACSFILAVLYHMGFKPRKVKTWWYSQPPLIQFVIIITFYFAALTITSGVMTQLIGWAGPPRCECK